MELKNEFALKELEHHLNQNHDVEYPAIGGFFCKTCGIGCVGEDVGNIKPDTQEEL